MWGCQQKFEKSKVVVLGLAESKQLLPERRYEKYASIKS